MKRVLTIAVSSLLGCGGKTDLPCFTPASDHEPLEYVCDECREAVAERAPCEGLGLIWTSTDDCIDDGGTSDSGDLLEVYCVESVARFCLSHEECPWRGLVGPAVDDVTCSKAGLESTYMASTRDGCDGWEGHDAFCCSTDGHIGFAGR